MMLVQIFFINEAYGDYYEVVVTGMDTAHYFIHYMDIMTFLADYSDCTIYTAL